MSTSRRPVATFTAAQRATRTRVETMLLTPEIVRTWASPPFQRPCKVTAKVVEVSLQIKADGGVIPGVLTIGQVDGDLRTYLVDGQHRREGFLLTDLAEGFADVRHVTCRDMAELGEEFVQLNSAIVRVRPDDVLRGLEASSPGLSLIRTRCPFVGYEQIRRGSGKTLLSMSTALRCWFGSAPDTPVTSPDSATNLARKLDVDDAAVLCAFLDAAARAWGRDGEYARLWSGLNLVLCMWLYRRLVVSRWSDRVRQMSGEQFTKCLMSLSADAGYVDWLVGRHVGEHDRSPAYRRIRENFLRRLQADTGTRPLLPSPPWYGARGSNSPK